MRRRETRGLLPIRRLLRLTPCTLISKFRKCVHRAREVLTRHCENVVCAHSTFHGKGHCLSSKVRTASFSLLSTVHCNDSNHFPQKCAWGNSVAGICESNWHNLYGIEALYAITKSIPGGKNWQIGYIQK